jgi:hypothetical protein
MIEMRNPGVRGGAAGAGAHHGTAAGTPKIAHGEASDYLGAGGPIPDALALEGPQPLLREVPPGAPYPVEALGPLRPAVEAVAGAVQAPAAIPAASALAVASLAVQGHADVETLGGPRPTSLFLLTVARSGERKTTCDAALLTALRDFEKEQARAHRTAFQSWQNAHALWSNERSRILGEAKRGQGEGRTAAQADLEALGPEPAMPPLPDRTVAEPTPEGLTRLFALGQPSLGLFSDEGGQFLGGHGMNSDNRQKTLAALNSLWQGDSIRRTRAGDGHMTLYGRRLALHLMTQPVAAHAFLADPLAEGMGFLARCLIAEPPSTIGTRLAAKARHDPAALAAFGARLRDILEVPLPMCAETRELRPRTLPLSAGARELLTRFADAIELAQAPGGELAHVTAAASKAAEQAARIAGVLCLWRDLHAAEVSLADMADGIELVQHYLAEAARLADAATVSAEIDKAERLRRWLLETWPHPEILPAEVVRHAPIRALREGPAARAALRLLEAHGWIVALPPGTVVRGAFRKEAWAIVRGAGA